MGLGLLKKPYQAEHKENRMSYEGDVFNARKHYFSGKAPNLERLLKNRFQWMNTFIKPSHKGLELGAGAGFSKLFITSPNYQITDFADYDWLDIKGIDALNTPFENNSIDFIVSSNMIHHLYSPMLFFREMDRILKPGGVVLIQEINASLMMRLILRLMRHEGYSFEPIVFDEAAICNDPNDLWSANCAIPNLLFDNPSKFEKEVSTFKVIETGFSEFFMFLNSGGVIAKTFFIPLPNWALSIIEGIDWVLTRTLPSVFALQRQVVLQKR